MVEGVQRPLRYGVYSIEMSIGKLHLASGMKPNHVGQLTALGRRLRRWKSWLGLPLGSLKASVRPGQSFESSHSIPGICASIPSFRARSRACMRRVKPASSSPSERASDSFDFTSKISPRPYLAVGQKYVPQMEPEQIKPGTIF